MSLALLGTLGCLAKPNAPEVSTTVPQPVVALNGISVNGIGANGIALNGIALNGIALNGIALNGIALNGIALNGIALNGIALNGIMLNGIALNGIALNGIALNGIALNGIALNGIALNGIALNGVYVKNDPALRVEFKRILGYLVSCALPAGRCIQATDVDGSTLSYCGSSGLDPQWESSPPNLAQAGAVGQCVLNRALADGQDAQATQAVVEAFKVVLTYMVECALPAGAFVTLTDEVGASWVLSGALGLAPEWSTGPLSSTGQKRVSACLGARSNAAGKHVRISLRGAGVGATTTVERKRYAHHEGAFWGNLFSSQPYLRTCNVQGGGVVGRVCTSPGGCGFQSQGECMNVCAAQDPVAAFFSDCKGADDAAVEHEVLSTFLPVEERVFAGGLNHACTVDEAGAVFCWGANEFGQLGDGTKLNSAAPVAVPISNVVSVVPRERATCARKNDGSVWCWGRNTYGGLGNGTTTDSLVPVQAGVSDAVLLTGGTYHTCAMTADGSVWCWGYNANGQIGDGTNVDRPSPKKVAITDVVSIATGNYHTCALKADGSVWCWGLNDYGQLGDGSTVASRSTPAASLLSNAATITAGSRFTIALKGDGSVWGWGNSWNYQLATGTLEVRTPIRIGAAELGYNVTQIGSGQLHNCARTTDGSVWCWGDNAYSQVGNVRRTNVPSRVFTDSKQISINDYQSYARDAGGRWWGWGFNSYGALGVGGTTNQSNPARITNHSCGDGNSDSARESVTTCGADFCATCSVTDCSACGYSFTYTADASVCASRQTYEVSDCTLCGTSGSGKKITCNTCLVCVSSYSCRTCSAPVCSACGTN